MLWPMALSIRLAMRRSMSLGSPSRRAGRIAGFDVQSECVDVVVAAGRSSQMRERSILSRWSSPPSLRARVRRASMSRSCWRLAASARSQASPPGLDARVGVGEHGVEKGLFEGEWGT